jgi:hypothetical protein
MQPLDENFGTIFVSIVIAMLLTFSFAMGFVKSDIIVKFEKFQTVTTDNGDIKSVKYFADFTDVTNFERVCDECEISEIEYNNAKSDKNFVKIYRPQIVEASRQMFYFVILLIGVSVFYITWLKIFKK